MSSPATSLPPLPDGYKLQTGSTDSGSAPSGLPPLPTGYTLHDNALGNTQPEDKGAFAGFKRALSNIVSLPVSVYHAFADDPKNAEEQQSAQQAFGGHLQPLALGLDRMVVQPMQAEKQLAQKYDQAAANAPDEQIAADFRDHAGAHRIASMVPLVGPIAGSLAERWNSGDQAGAAAELATYIAAPKLAEKGVSGAASLLPKAAQEMYQSALKPSTRVPLAKTQAAINTGLNEGIPVSEAGMEKLGSLIDDVNDKIKAEIAADPTRPINKFAVASRLNDVAQKFSNQVSPTDDLNAIANTGNDFIGTAPNPISANDAQAMKQGTYQQLKGKAYGELKSATVESQKALARGLKEEIAAQFPELSDLNASDAQLYNLQSALEKAVARIGNRQLIGIGTPLAGAGVKAMTGSTAGAAVAGIMKAALDNPAVKSRLAIALNKAGVKWAAANSSISDYSQALALTGASANSEDRDTQ